MSKEKSEAKTKGKAPAKLKLEKGEKSEKKKEHISASKFFAILIIILITIALVGTSIIYVILPQFNKKNQLRFGTYNGEKILLEANSTLYSQYINVANQHPELANSPDLSSQYQLWNQAYQNSVIFTAVAQMAKQSGVRAPQQLVDREILASGYFNGEDGKFSEAKFNETKNDVKANLSYAYKNQVPFKIIVGDHGACPAPKAEKDFVADMASTTRTFEYIPIDFRLIPDEFASNYLASDPAKFRKIGLSAILSGSKENIDKAYEALQGGTEWSDAVSQYSENKQGPADGKMGDVYLYNLQPIFSEEQLEQIFATEEGSYTSPIEAAGSFTIFRIDSAPSEPDFSSEETKIAVKSYLLEHETDTAGTFVQEAAAEIAKDAKVDFDEAALERGIETISVAATPANIGGSNFMGSLAGTDKLGLLAKAATDANIMKTLYTEEPGYISDPIKSGNNYVVVKITGDAKDLSQGQAVNLFYPYYGQMMAQNDFLNTILTSDKHDNNFIQAFLSLYGQNPEKEAPEKTSK